MAIFIGGDTQELEYDFGLKVAGSVAECPMKMYKAEVDPAALPAPTDVSWTEVTSQTVLDKLKFQNEIPVSAIATDKSTVTWNGKTLPKTSVLKVLDDFAGKVSGSVVENPHISKYSFTNSLQAPSSFTFEFLDTLGQSSNNYASINTLNGTSAYVTRSNAGDIPQQLFSFNIIEMFERKYGAIPKETVAEKVAWLKSNLSKITCNWYGYGVGPSGNKSYLTPYMSSENVWASGYGNTTNTPSLVQRILNVGSSWNDVIASVDPNGFVHFLAYTDASDGVTPSTIYTDYVSLELTLKAPENLITATNTLSDIVTDFTGKVSGSVSENANISKWQNASSLTAPTGTWASEFSSGGYTNINSINGTSYSATTSVNTQIAQQLFSFNIVAAVEKQLGQPIPAVDKVQWCKDNVFNIKCDWYGYGSCPSGNKANLVMWRQDNSSWDTTNALRTHTNSTVTNLNNFSSSIDLRLDSNEMIHILAYTDPSDGVTASTIYTDYIKLTIKLKYIPTYDFYTDSNTRRDAGLTDIVLVKRSIGDMTSDFTGKVAGSVVENPNVALFSNVVTSLRKPSDFNVSAYVIPNSVSTLNGVCDSTTTSTNLTISQQLFQFNLIEIVQRQLGTSIPGADTASKVQWLKDNLAIVKCDWYGYGRCPTGNKAYLAQWANNLSAWYGTLSNTSLTVSLLNRTTDSVLNYIDSNGFVNYLAYTDASDGVTPSTINTDYIKLTLTFKTDTVGYEYFTNNSTEVSVTTANKASALLIECDLTPIANALYGGSNSALKSALKSITADVYAMGSGANVNQLGYGLTGKRYSPIQSIFADFSSTFTNVTSSVSKITNTTYNADWAKDMVTTSNKIYIIVYSTYKSDGTIASEVNLDYAKIKVSLSRVPDVISNPPTINLTDTWSILVRGFSPAWDSTLSNVNRRVFSLRNSARGIYAYIRDNTMFYFTQDKTATTVSPLSNTKKINQLKYQIINMLFIKQKGVMTFYILLNNGSVVKDAFTISNTDNDSGNYTFFPLSNDTIYINNADAFLDSIVYLPNQTFDDITAEAILRGTKEGFEMPELFDINAVTLHANATRSNGVITLNATGGYQNSIIDIPVLPNNKYEITYITNTGNNYIDLIERYNNIDTISHWAIGNVSGGGTQTTTFITGSKTNNLRFYLQNNTSGTFTFSNISLKLKM